MPKPVTTFAGLYSGWIEKIRMAQGERSRRPLLLNNLKIYLPRIVFYLLSLFGAFRILPDVMNGLAVPHSMAQIVLAMVMFPFLVGLLYAVDAILWQTFIFPFMTVGGREMQNALHHVLRFAVVVVSGLIMLTVTPMLMPGIPVGFVVLGIVLLSATVLWGAMRKVHEKMEKTIVDFFDHEELSEAQAEQTHDELLRLIQTKYPWGVETQDFLLPLNETNVNRPIKELGLRERTGVTIVAVYRDEKAVINPAADVVLLPGDVILLMGSKEQLFNAVQFLNSRIKGDA